MVYSSKKWVLGLRLPQRRKKKKKKRERNVGLRYGDKGDLVLGVVANLSDISVGPLPLREVGQLPPTRSANLRCCAPPRPRLSPFSSHFSLEPLVPKHQEGGEGCAFVSLVSVWQRAHQWHA